MEKMKKKKTVLLWKQIKATFLDFFRCVSMQYIDHLGNSLVELTIYVFSRFNLCFGFYFRAR